ncbi:Dps family protein [Pseudobacteroides cellulosolvens]|uniref:Ferritin Dps family protein n=1 Tax=Pseudobacteroides cellulosolvens ATCC 35603 = DSM 2933 TaxID=398512 RepID=A0A0L6JQ32_9FIRM|nr:ferritin-like domain-containing protein [Pseudobacteroides cellulosolvens]KNY27893.1 Ferritin Dps family protein [Pseudobacteroides cellulosolvens ATCC 35603 = DSM 2933]
MEPVQTTSQVPNDIKATMKNVGNFQGRFNLEKSGFNENMPGHKTSHDMILRQQPRTVKQEGSGINLPYEVRKEMALMLDDHQCALSVSLHQYNKHHWMSEGAEGFISLHELLEEHIEKTTKHIDEVGERVTRLGGVPTAHPVTQHELSYIKHEVEGRYSIRDFLRNDLEHELKIQQMLRQTIKRAHDLEDFGTVETLEEVLKDREDLGYHLYSVLEDDSLVRGMNHLMDSSNQLKGDGNMNYSNKLQ